MINYENIYNYKDRNGHELKYGDKVLVKYLGFTGENYGQKIGIATIIGFTPKYVAMIWCIGAGNTFVRKSKNVVWISKIDKWKYYI